VAVMEWLLSVLPPGGGWVLDPFAGSRSTVLAGEAAGLSCVAVEEHGEIAERAVGRLEEEGFRVVGRAA